MTRSGELCGADTRYRFTIAPRPTHALFVLLPPTQQPDEFLAGAPPELRVALAGLTLRRYPPADDWRHLASLVRAGRDPLATRWRRGLLTAVVTGTAIGMIVNGSLAAWFGMWSGLLEIAVPLGAGVGAFLGGFTAAMTGTERPREELRDLWPHVRKGAVLVQWSSADREALAALALHAESHALPCVHIARHA